MKLIAWDTSSKVGTLAALEWDENPQAGTLGVAGIRLVSEWTLNVQATHSERLLWAIHQVLDASRWKLSDVDLFAVGVGPGSFTGLRIGVTTARTLAHTLNKPLIGVSSLAALARPASEWLREQGKKGNSVLSRTVVVATTDACKGELFALWGSARSIADCVVLADGDAPGLWKRGVEEQVLTPDELVQAVKRKLAQGDGDAFWLPLGEGRKRYPESWNLLPQERELESPFPFSENVQGRYVGILAWEAWSAGLSREALTVHPRYLRASDAELKLKAGLLPAASNRDLSQI